MAERAASLETSQLICLTLLDPLSVRLTLQPLEYIPPPCFSFSIFLFFLYTFLKHINTKTAALLSFTQTFFARPIVAWHFVSQFSAEYSQRDLLTYGAQRAEERKGRVSEWINESMINGSIKTDAFSHWYWTATESHVVFMTHRDIDHVYSWIDFLLLW